VAQPECHEPRRGDGNFVGRGRKKLANAVSQRLARNGDDVTIADSGDESFHLLHQQVFKLILLDVMLPHWSGIEALKDLRRGGFKMPVLILTSSALHF
jgi:DNA-binding response OmpR family regulator